MGVLAPPPGAAGVPSRDAARDSARHSTPGTARDSSHAAARAASPGPSRAVSLASGWLDEARAWSRGRLWYWRAPLVLAFAWSELRRLRDPFYGDWFSGITLGVHELGHIVLFWAGSFVSIAGGSLFQVAAPIVAGWILARQRDWFGITVAGAWLASSLHGLAAYVGDARARDLPLVGLFPDPVHDWEWLLGHLGILTWDRGLALLLRIASAGIGIASVAAGAWLCVEMARNRKAG